MSTEENKALARKVYEIFARGDLDSLDQYLAPDIVDHNLAPGQGPGLQGIKDYFREYYNGFSDNRVEVEDQVAEGDKVVSRITFHARHTGQFLGVPPTGREVTQTGMDLLRIAGGRIVERWGNQDDLALLQQLGILPDLGQSERQAA